MSFQKRLVTQFIALSAALALSACADGPTPPPVSTADLTARFDAVKFWDATASTTWNSRAITLLGQRPPANAQAAVSRILTYLSVAQYRAVLYAFDVEAGQKLGASAAALALAGTLEK